jgi:hypothetical protein
VLVEAVQGSPGSPSQVLGLASLLSAELPPELEGARLAAARDAAAGATTADTREVLDRILLGRQLARMPVAELVAWGRSSHPLYRDTAEVWAGEVCSFEIPTDDLRPELLAARLSSAEHCSRQQAVRAGFPSGPALAEALEMMDYSVSGRFHAEAVELANKHDGELGTMLLVAVLRNGVLDVGRRQALRMKVLRMLAGRGLTATALLDAGASEREVSVLVECRGDRAQD